MTCLVGRFDMNGAETYSKERLMDKSTHSKWQGDTDKTYTAPSVELLGSLSELTLTTTNGCGGNGKDKTFTHTDGFGHGQTGCLS